MLENILFAFVNHRLPWNLSSHRKLTQLVIVMLPNCHLDRLICSCFQYFELWVVSIVFYVVPCDVMFRVRLCLFYLCHYRCIIFIDLIYCFEIVSFVYHVFFKCLPSHLSKEINYFIYAIHNNIYFDQTWYLTVLIDKLTYKVGDVENINWPNK